jgi:chemotaxis family two-component system response regulator PixG
MIAKDSSISRLSDQFEQWSQQQLTGRLDVSAEDSQPWSLYFCMGRLAWVRGGKHSLRRWRRLLQNHCSQLYTDPGQVSSLDRAVLEQREYESLIQWVKQQQITGEQAVTLIRSAIAEVLFDILQQEETKAVAFTSDHEDAIEASLTLLGPEQTLSQVQLAWSNWSKAGLASVSPNFAPVLRQPEQLQQSLSPQVYQTLVKLINGQRTLRDVALRMKQDPLLLLRTLAPYIRTKLIELVRLPDLTPPPLPNPDSGSSSGNGNVHAASGPTPKGPSLVMSVDDSFLERQIMERILTQLGYKFLGIEDAVQALPSIIEHKPALIFLDLIMPIVNGYELCSQIRKISQLKDIPVVILTGNDGIVDRVRAKLVGATDFLSKPIDEKQVQGVLQRYVIDFTARLPSTGD